MVGITDERVYEIAGNEIYVYKFSHRPRTNGTMEIAQFSSVSIVVFVSVLDQRVEHLLLNFTQFWLLWRRDGIVRYHPISFRFVLILGPEKLWDATENPIIVCSNWQKRRI